MDAKLIVPETDWSRFSALLDEALSLPPAERAAWLERLPPAEAAWHETLERMLADDSGGGGARDSFMREPVRLQALGLAARPADAGQPAAGASVGPYRLLRAIGKGGMGDVWLADRIDGALKRRVALKLPRIGWDTAGLDARMARERDILAGLEHPNIARLYDAGIDAQGRPYLALEYVEGRAVDAYCDGQGLGVPERLAIFLQVARAVAYAHARLVVHRDLKPSNILVTGDGQVRLLDFGIAKLVQGAGDPAPARELTEVAGRAFTPDYAAPELVRGEPVTVAVDIYSLGIVLFELLAGARPYRLDARSPAGLAAAVSSMRTPMASSVAGPERARLLRGDLDTILAKALKPDASMRYPTVDAFADDVARHLAGMPVLARPDSLAYRASRLLRRHRLPAIVAALVVLAAVGGAEPVAAVMLALGIGAGVALWQAGIARREAARARDEARQAQRERDRAVALSQRSEGVVDFLQIMITELAAADERITLAELLARGEALALASMRREPEQQAIVLNLVAGFYVNLGDPAGAEPRLRDAIALLGPDADATIVARLEAELALVLHQQGNDEIAGQMLERWRGHASLEPQVAAVCEQYLSQIARDRQDGRAALAHAQAARDRLRDSGHRLPSYEVTILADIACALQLEGRVDEADRQFAEVVSLLRDLGRGDSPMAAAVINNWGLLCNARGESLRALSLFEQAIETGLRRAPDRSPPPYATYNRAYALLLLARLDPAREEALRTLRVAEQAGNQAFRLGACLVIANIHIARGELDAADALLGAEAEALLAQPAGGFVSINHAVCRGALAIAQGQLDDAEAALTPVIDFFRHRGMHTPSAARALRLRAELAMARGDRAAALRDAGAALASARALQGTGAPSSHAGLALLLQGRLQLAAGDGAHAAGLLGEAASVLAATLGEDHPDTCKARDLAASAGTRVRPS